MTPGITHCDQCNKKAYPSHAAAIRFALRYSKRSGKGLRVYREPRCGHIHLTSKASR